ncbi:MAG: RNA polymerase sigma factor [Acidobacteriota bacterium]|nr:RNA polymerase sigma factor [Acidobacteriota bacterium]
MPYQAMISESVPVEQAPATPFDDLEAVLALYEGKVFRFLLASTRDADAARTLTQDTFLKAWLARASFRNDCSIATWLMRIAMNLLRDHTRTNRFRFWKKVAAEAIDAAEPEVQIAHPDSSVESRLIASEEMTLIWETVGKLSEKQRSVFLLRFVEEMEIGEIATVTGLPLSTVKSHLYRALGAIRKRHHSLTRSAKETL